MEEPQSEQLHIIRKEIPWRDLILQFLSVTFGVLLAFQLSSWNERKKEAEQYNRLLGRVAIENRQNLEAIVDQESNIERENVELESLIHALVVKDISRDSMSELLGNLLGLTTGSFSSNHLEAAVNMDNSLYLEENVPILNQLLIDKENVEDVDKIRIDQFFDDILKVLEGHFDFSEYLIYDDSMLESTRFKNMLFVYLGTLQNKIDNLNIYKKSVLSFDSIAVANRWIEKSK